MTLEHGSSLDGLETIASTTPSDEMESGQASAGSARTNGLATIGRWMRRRLARWRLVVAAVLVVTAMVFAATLFCTLYRPDQRVGEAAVHPAIQAASDGAVAVLTYSYDHLYRDFATAKSHLTGGFLTYYSKFADDVVGPMAQKGQLTTTAKVIRAAISDLHPDSAVVLVFVDQNTVSTTKKDPVKTESAFVVTMTKINGSWLIAKFNPVG
jgi:Mce-associated membrane protein